MSSDILPAATKDKCTQCGGELGSMVVGSSTGLICPQCDCRNRPWRDAESFRDVLNADDQVMMRDLMAKHVSLEDKRTIVREFNERGRRQYQRRCVSLLNTDTAD